MYTPFYFHSLLPRPDEDNFHHTTDARALPMCVCVSSSKYLWKSSPNASTCTQSTMAVSYKAQILPANAVQVAVNIFML